MPIYLAGGRYEALEGVSEGDYLLSYVVRGGAEIQRRQYMGWRRDGVAYRYL